MSHGLASVREERHQENAWRDKHPQFVQSNLAKVEFLPLQSEAENFSLPDIISNVLLVIPFGLFLAGSGFRALDV